MTEADVKFLFDIAELGWDQAVKFQLARGFARAGWAGLRTPGFSEIMRQFGGE